MADFVTLSLSDKISLLAQLERRQVLGSMKSQGSGERVATEFTGDTAHLLNQISKLQEAIRRDPDFNNQNPLWEALMRDRPQAQTRVSFGGSQGNAGHYPNGY
jgi:hypothetical protein